MATNRRQVITGASVLAAHIMAPSAHASPARARALMAVGDWGRDGADHQSDVANQMNLAAADFDCVGVLSVGDNFYEDGVQSVDDPKWRSSFEDVYSGSQLRPLPWYVALGNHDYGGVPQAQIDYTQRSHRWIMPSRYFKVSAEALGVPQTDLFVIDTTPLVLDNGVGDDPTAVNVRTQDRGAQLAWLEAELAASSAKFKIVAGHHTIYSGGSTHGDTADLVEGLLPILKRHRVTAYINGHDHDLQHIFRDGLHFICAGAGSRTRPVNSVEGTQFCMARSGFAILSYSEAGLALEFRDHQGTRLHQVRLVPKSSTSA